MTETPDDVYERVLAEEQAKGSSPPVAEGRAKAARHRARKAETPPQSGGDDPVVSLPSPTESNGADVAQPAAVASAAAAAPALAPKEALSPSIAPDRIQRLLAVVKPEAIQRVEKEPIDRVNTWPHLMVAEFIALLAITVFLVLFSTFVDAPFRELANINQTPNPSKAPWYFLGLQELLRYFHPQIAGVTIPTWIILGLMAAPFIDRNPSTKPTDRKLAIVLFTIFLLMNAVLVILGSLFRGPGFNFIYPWQTGIFFEL